MRNMIAVLWCNGKTPSNDLIKRVLTKDKEIFGVDGGAEKALKAGINVQKVLGDFDSVNIEEWKGESEYLPNQNISDFGKSIKYLVRKGYTQIEALGIDGGSPEHFLGVWAVLAEIEDSVKIILHHENRITYRIHPDYEDTQIFIENGKEFSIFALTYCNEITITGAKWDMKNEKLSLSSRGLHNQGTGKNISIKADGIVVLII